VTLKRDTFFSCMAVWRSGRNVGVLVRENRPKELENGGLFSPIERMNGSP
jgi:hypothetical protein